MACAPLCPLPQFCFGTILTQIAKLTTDLDCADLFEKAQVTQLHPVREENKYSQRRGSVIPNMNTMTSPR